MSQVRLFLLFLVLMSSQWSARADESIPLHHQSADTCKLCHKEIFKIWRTSRHAQSAPLRNPLMKAFYTALGLDGRKEGQTTGEGSYPGCLNCHAPNAALDGKTKLDAMPAYSEGVNCVACHQLASYLGVEDKAGRSRLGIKAYKTSEQLQGPNGFSVLDSVAEDAKGNPHLGQAIVFHGKVIPSLPLKANARQLKTADACLGCHQGRSNAHGISLCATGMEVADSQSRVDCLACHMVPVEGIADHGMGMSRDLPHERLGRAMLLQLRLRPVTGGLLAKIVLTSKLPHGLPTGTPFKSLVLRLKAYDAQGALLWESPKDDPDMGLSLELVDDAGRPSLPQLATRVARDTRLRPFGAKAVDVEIPKAGVALIRAEVHFQPLWPKLLEIMPELPQELGTERLIAWTEVKLEP